MRYYLFSMLFLAGVCNAIGDYATKKWLLHSAVNWLWIAVPLYFLSIFLWFVVFKAANGMLGKAAILWSVMIAIAGASIGILIFGERPTVANYIGIVLGIASIMLVSK